MKGRPAKWFPSLPGVIMLACLSLGAGAPGLQSDRSPDHDYDPPAPGSYSLPIVKPAADGDVLDSDGTPVRLRELTHGRVTVLSFIYTRCAAVKACPYATGVLNELHQLSQEDRALAQQLRLVSLSFDPGNDTPQRMADYSAWARARKTGCQWRFLTTRSPAELQPILEAYGQAVDKRANPADPQGPLYHILRVYLIDARGQIRNIYNSDTLDPRLLLADIKTLLLDQPAEPAK
jgi:protein SCO1/2